MERTDILELMKEANFVGMFVGIETPEADALDAIKKGHNNAVPMMESIRTLNSYGLEITSGIILGLDSETNDTEQRLKQLSALLHLPFVGNLEQVPAEVTNVGTSDFAATIDISVGRDDGGRGAAAGGLNGVLLSAKADRMTSAIFTGSPWPPICI